MIVALLLLLQDSAKLAQEIEYANAKDKPQFHVQAVRKLKDRGGPAVAEDIVRYVASHGHNALSIAFTEARPKRTGTRSAPLPSASIRNKLPGLPGCANTGRPT